MRAVILVGGFGTRLRPLTLTTPKQLLPVLDVPMIERKIAHLVAQGVDDVIFSMGYRPDAFYEAYPDNSCGGARVQYVVEPEPLGTAGAIAFAARQAGINETFLAMNGDTLTDLDVQGLIGLHQDRGAQGTISLTPVEDPSRFGVVPTGDSDQVLEFIEKPPAHEAPTNLINAGTYILEPSFLDRVPEGQECSIERQVFPQIVAEGGLFAGHFDRYWLDIGTPEAYLQANLDALNQDLNGQAYRSGEARIEQSANVDQSVIGHLAQIGANVRLTRSVVMPGAVIEDEAVIEDSIVGEYSHIGSRAKLSALSVVGGRQRVADGANLVGEKVGPPQS